MEGCVELEHNGGGIYSVTDAGGATLNNGAGAFDGHQSGCKIHICIDDPPQAVTASAERAYIDSGDEFAYERNVEQDGLLAQPHIQGGPAFAFSLKGDSLARYSVVSHFFLRASEIMKSSHDNGDGFLIDIGISPENAMRDSFGDIVVEAVRILGAGITDPKLRGAAFAKRQYARIREKAARLGVLYRFLLRQLNSAEVSPELLEAYLAEEVLPAITLFSTEPIEARYFEAMKGFDEQIQ